MGDFSAKHALAFSDAVVDDRATKLDVFYLLVKKRGNTHKSVNLSLTRQFGVRPEDVLLKERNAEAMPRCYGACERTSGFGLTRLVVSFTTGTEGQEQDFKTTDASVETADEHGKKRRPRHAAAGATWQRRVVLHSENSQPVFAFFRG